MHVRSDGPAYVRTPLISSAPTVPFFLVQSLNGHLGKQALSAEAMRASGHWKHEKMLDERERRLRRERQVQAESHLEQAGNEFLLDFEKRAVERERKRAAAIGEAKAAIEVARANGTAEYKEWMNATPDPFEASLEYVRDKADHLGHDTFRVSLDVNNDGVIDENEVYEDPHDLANAYAARLGLTPTPKKAAAPEPLKSFFESHATSFAASRNPAPCRSILDSTVAEDYQIRHCEDALREVLQMCCVDNTHTSALSRAGMPDGSADLHKWIACGEVLELFSSTPAHVIADCEARVDNWHRRLTEMVDKQTRQVATDHIHKLMTFAYMLKAMLRNHLETGFTVASYFDNRAVPVFQGGQSKSAMKLPESPVFVRL